ncbi:MAG: NAD(P)H-binding protein [Lysobacter sp.]|nr:NAD(P)H-binding protein [Lysobacter sp.]
MKIGINGASGQLGKVALMETAARGGEAQVIGISRTPDALPSALQGRYGDYDRPESLSAAYAGLDRLLIIPSPDVRHGVRARQFVSAIDAAVQAGVGHIVLVSSAATREAVEPRMFAAYWTAEQHLIRTAPRWTILRMNYFAESYAQLAPMALAGGVMTGLKENRVAFVSRDDVAAAAAGILIGEDHGGAIYNATGPAALSGAERAAITADVAGQPLRYATADEAALRDALARSGMPQQYLDAMIDIERDFASGAFDLVSGDVERLAARPPRTLREVLMRTLR